MNDDDESGTVRVYFGLALLIVAEILALAYEEVRWLLMMLPGFGLLVWGENARTPLTDEQKRAFGQHLPPHLQSK